MTVEDQIPREHLDGAVGIGFRRWVTPLLCLEDLLRTVPTSASNRSLAPSNVQNSAYVAGDDCAEQHGAKDAIPSERRHVARDGASLTISRGKFDMRTRHADAPWTPAEPLA